MSETKLKTFREYLNSDASIDFKRICADAGTNATRRQVSKFRLKRGKAYHHYLAGTERSFNISLG